MRRRRLRGLALGATAVLCGVAASSQVSAREREVEAQVGEPVEVVVARREVRQGARIGPRTAARLFERRLVPARYVPPGALAAPAQAVGLRTAVAIPAGTYVAAPLLEAPGAGAGGGAAAMRPGERAVELTVAGGEDLLAAGGGAGMRVDVLVTTEARDGGGATRVALENVELLAIRRASQGARDGAGPAGVENPPGGAFAATLRVPVRDAVRLTAADGFAREIRLLARPERDGRSVVGLAASAAGEPP